jgi:glycerophosphoryl diester phosphodiesterase
MTAALPLLSAHRGGPGADTDRGNTIKALLEAATLDCEYVEIDVQRCRGGVHVVYHDDYVLDGDRPLSIASLTFDEFRGYADTYLVLDDALQVLRGKKKVHLDLKFLSDPEDGGSAAHGHEVALVEHLISVLGADNVIVTTLEDESVRAIRAWSRERYPDLLVGLSLGRDVSGQGRRRLIATRLGEIFPTRRIRACDANLVVCHRQIAKLRVANWARRWGLPILVWTVDDEDELRYWLRDGRAWLITTNFPRRAGELRDELRRELATAGTNANGAPPQ